MPHLHSAAFWRSLGFLGVCVATALAAACATASSPDAWDDFRRQVAEACTAAAKLQDPDLRIDPYGTDSYGIASVTGGAEDGTERTVICVVRKSPDGIVDAEIGAGLDEWIAPPD